MKETIRTGDRNGEAATRQAEALLDIALSLPRRYSHAGMIVGAREAMQNVDLARDLLKLATFSAGLEDAVNASLEEAGRDIHAPTVLLGMGLHYAIEVAPARAPGDPIDLSLLAQHVRRIEGAVGLIAVDPRLLDGISRLARERIMKSPEPGEVTS